MTALSDDGATDAAHPRRDVDPLQADPTAPDSLQAQRRYMAEFAEHCETLKSIAQHMVARYVGAPRVPNPAGGIDDLNRAARVDSDGFERWLREIVERAGNGAHELHKRTAQLDELLGTPRR